MELLEIEIEVEESRELRLVIMRSIALQRQVYDSI
jgi:hypothetical protein